MVAGEYEEAYRELEGILGERMRREDPTGSGASVSAANASEPIRCSYASLR